jgi:transcriptional regulator with GAF, ATPase, and Fis domain
MRRMVPDYRRLAVEALAAQRQGRLKEAAARYLEALASVPAEEPEDLDSTCGNLGSLLYDLGDLVQSEVHLRKGISLARRAAHAGTEAALQRYLARVTRDQGRLKESLQALERSERLLRDAPDPPSLLSTLSLTAEMAERADDLERAESAAARALDLAATLGKPERVAELRRKVQEIRELLLARGNREALWEEVRNLRHLQQVNAALNSELDIQRLLNLIMDAAVEIGGAERGFLILLEEAGPLQIAAARNIAQEDLQRPEFRFSRSIAQHAIETGEAVRADDAQADARFQSSESVKDLRLRSVFCVPFRAKGRIIGALYLDHPFRKDVFRPSIQRMLEGLCDQAAIALSNARLHRERLERQRALEGSNRRLNHEIAHLQESLDEERKTWALTHAYEGIITRAPAMRRVLQLLDQVTESDVPILIQGETGTGKELVAKALHANGPRRKRPFLTINCAALSESLLESELFGHCRGAFTGAVKDKEGLFQAADGGTLFLDEIGEMIPTLQAKLLRAIELGEILPVGASTPVHVDVRILSATHQPLEAMVKRKAFREDLFYRLKVITVDLPPLKERREDIPLLVEHFLREGRREAPPEVTPEAMPLLKGYAWPGNVRQLMNEVKRWLALSIPVVRPEDLGAGIRGVPDGISGPQPPLKESVAVLERDAIRRAMADAGGRKSKAARTLGISRPTLDKKLREYGLGEA